MVCDHNPLPGRIRLPLGARFWATYDLIYSGLGDRMILAPDPAVDRLRQLFPILGFQEFLVERLDEDPATHR